MNYSKRFILNSGIVLCSTAVLFGCAGRKPDPEKAPLAKVTKVSDGGVYAEMMRGSIEVGQPITIFRKECKEIPVRMGAMKNCSNFEYGAGRVERRLEDGHVFVRSDAVSVPVGAQIRPSDME